MKKASNSFILMYFILLSTLVQYCHCTLKVLYPSTVKKRFENGKALLIHTLNLINYLAIIPSVVTVYGNSPFDTPKSYTLVDGGSNACVKFPNLRKTHHNIQKGIAVLIKSSLCSYKKII